MAYADFDFYIECYHGEELSEETAEAWLDRASDEIDSLTFGRLTFAFPTNVAHAVKVKKAVCAVADALLRIDVQRRASAAKKATDGTYRGAVSSISSGRESISYSLANSLYDAAATNPDAKTDLIASIASRYIGGIPDARGVNLLYAGGDACVL